MALGQIPPWLEVKPSDFVHAAQMGAEAGLQVARMNQAATEAAQNRAQRAGEAEQNRAFRQFEHQQQMELRAQELADRREETKAQLEARTAYNMAQLGLRASGQAETQARDEASRKRWEREQIERERHNLALEGGVGGPGGKPMTEFQRAEVEHWNRTTPAKSDPFDAQDRAQTLRRMGEIVRALDKNPPTEDRDRLVSEWMDLRDKQTDLDKKRVALAIPPAGPAAVSAPPSATAPAPIAPPPVAAASIVAKQSMSFPPAPMDPENRETDMVYATPKGPHKWNGSKWEPYVPGMPTEPTAEEPSGNVPEPGADETSADSAPDYSSGSEDLLDQP